MLREYRPFRFSTADLSDPAALDEAARKAPEVIDAALFRIARGGGALDLAIGETLVEMKKGDRMIRLGASSLTEYAVEKLGEKARTVYELVELAEAVAGRPLLRRAVACGAVTPGKAIAVSPVAFGDAELAWIPLAMELTEKDLRQKVREAGKVPPERYELANLRISMTPEQQDDLNRGISLVRMLHGFDLPEWAAVEAMCVEAMSSFADHVPEPEEPRAPEPTFEEKRAALAAYEEWVVEHAHDDGALDRRLRVYEEALAVIGDGEDPIDGGLTNEKLAPLLHDRLLRLFETRRDFDEPLGRLANLFLRYELWSWLDYGNLDLYCRERLGRTRRWLESRAWLERKMTEMPALRTALAEGTLTFSKLVEVARVATPEDVADRIRDAEDRSHQSTSEQTGEEKVAKDRAKGIRQVWGPRDAAETISLGIRTIQAAERELGGEIDAGEALAIIARHLAAVQANALKRMLRKASPAKWELYMRYGGLCARDGCRNRAKHFHHIVYRSRRGGDEISNLLPVCGTCHLRGIHDGHLTVTGHSGRRLVWRVKENDLVPREEWIQEHPGDSRRSRR